MDVRVQNLRKVGPVAAGCFCKLSLVGGSISVAVDLICDKTLVEKIWL